MRQLRWCRRQLVFDMYIGFTDEQLNLLYQAIESSFGKENVEFVDKTSSNTISRIYHIKVDNENHYVRY